MGKPPILRQVGFRMTALAFMATLMLISGCTTGSRATADAFRLLGKDQVEVSSTQVADNPYPQALLKAPDLSSLLILGFVDEGGQTWLAGRLAAYKLDDSGLVIGMSGSHREIQVRIVGESPFQNLAAIHGSTRVQREYDWLPGYRMGIQVQSTLVRGKLESVEILGVKHALIRFDEWMEGGMSAHNVYWVDPTNGFIWKSRQQLSPNYVIELVQLKPYRASKD